MTTPQPQSRSREYEVSISDRLVDILGIDPVMLGPDDEFTYSWDGGYERLRARKKGSGTLEFQGVYHPDDGLCEGNPCRYCGKAFIE